jgi:exodeoxyribonuclease VII large subunit
MVLKKVTKIEAEEMTAETRVPTVGELTRRIAATLESTFDSVTVQGEISGWNRAGSGHTYFSLKDDKALLNAVIWKSRTISFQPRDGMKVVATGRITLYGPRGQYQLDCLSLMPLGQGELQLAFEALKRKLHEEGLFDAERKKPLPFFPRRIGVVTSATGAAIRDIINTLHRRMPAAHVVLRPALVQGAGSAEDIALAIRQFNQLSDIDLLIVGRGGGSIEDLWAFNEEAVARAIAGSRIPVISAVGHETDFTIADFVADLRAPTPTAAAELAVRDARELIETLRYTELRLTEEITEKLRFYHRELASLLRSRGLSRPLDLVHTHQQRLDDLQHRGALAARGAMQRTTEQLRLLETTLRTLNPENILKRGYAIVERDSRPVMNAGDLKQGDHVLLRMHDGEQRAVIEE